jgi:uncharacterized protein YgfB (UPF0149 family)
VNLPEYDDIAEALERSAAVISPAELHGICCGLLIKDAATPETRLQQIALGDTDKGDALADETAALIQQLLKATQMQLQDAELGFTLLAPDEDEPLEKRIQAACDWARGLVYGLAEQGVKPNDCPADSAEFIQDCLTLANNEYTVDEGSEEENEDLYFELLEFLRMGTLMAQEELQPLRAAPQLH